jgi:metal-sensitive transcriptional repressor
VKSKSSLHGAPCPGQVEAIERALDGEAGCEQVMHLIAGVRGAIAGLMAEVVEDHVHTLRYSLGPKIAYPLWAGVGLAFAGAGF